MSTLPTNEATRTIVLDGKTRKWLTVFAVSMLFVSFIGFLPRSSRYRSDHEWQRINDGVIFDFSEAGTIKDATLRRNASPVYTSVVTSTGTFQVRGDIAATAGDSVSLATVQGSSDRRVVFLCVLSSSKRACDPLM
jgi:hypothetical protein